MTTPQPAADARTRILDAAERAFAQHGLAGARVAAIAEEAGVNKAMLYYYFDSKEALQAAVVNRVMDQITEMVQSVVADENGPTDVALEAFFRGYSRVLAEHPHFVRLMMRGLLDGPEQLLTVVGPRAANVIPKVQGLLLRGQQRGAVNPAINPLISPPLFVSSAAFFALAGPMLQRVTGAPAEALGELWTRNTLEVLLHGFLARPEVSR